MKLKKTFETVNDYIHVMKYFKGTNRAVLLINQVN